jgi:polyphosphate kinase
MTQNPPMPPRSRVFSHQAHEDVAEDAWNDRDLSWLEFNRRVLHEALDARTPLLERAKFLAIFTSNLDEFFMKRVGAMRTRAFASGSAADVDAFNKHMSGLRQVIVPMLETRSSAYVELRGLLMQKGIRLASCSELTPAQRQDASVYFDRNVSPALTPLRMDPSNPFPFLSNLSLSWGFELVDRSSGEEIATRVKVPSVLRQWIPLQQDVPAKQLCYVALQELIRQEAHKLFPGLEVKQAMLFRVSRNADVAVEEDHDHTLRELIEEQVRQRRFEPVVRLEFGSESISSMREELQAQLHLGECDIYEMQGLLDYTGLFEIAAIDRADLRDRAWAPIVPKNMDPDSDLFSAIRAGDILVHHPYESFEATVERFIRDAANDPITTNIKMTVYRLGDDTPFVRSLIKAAETGKQVACLVELQARFDEERNLHWANELRKAGDHVIYGVRGLKTHTKMALVVRRESDGLRCYAHIASGNYHVKTAKLYTDYGLFTSDPVITRDVVNLFHYLTGYSRSPEFVRLLVAPLNMRQRFLDLIARERDHAEAGRPARIVAKMNQLEDARIIQALIEASQANVSIDLIVRGICCLKPGVPGFTQNIRVRSVIGRFLEHGRIFHFANGAADALQGEFYIGSADWMERNLSRRVEAVTPVDSPAARRRLWEDLQTELKDSRNAWTMHSDGSYEQLLPDASTDDDAGLGSHEVLMRRTRARHES